MRALEPEVANAVWEAVEALIPSREDNHPMGGHRSRIPDRICLLGILIRLVTGCSWESAEHLLDGAVSDTTLWARRDEWTDAGVFDALVSEVLAAYDRVIGLDLPMFRLTAASTRRPVVGTEPGKTPATGPNRGGSGLWQSTGRVSRWVGPPMGPAATTASCSNPPSTPPPTGGLLFDVKTLHLDRAYDRKAVRALSKP